MTYEYNDDKPVDLNVTFYDEFGEVIETPNLETLAQHENAMVSINVSVAIPVAIALILLCLATAFFFLT